MGRSAYDMLTSLTNSEAYKSLSDAQKAEAVEKVYTYTKETAREAAVPTYSATTSWVGKADDLAAQGISVEDYIVQSVIGSGTSDENTKDLLGMSWLSDGDRAKLVSADYGKSLTGGNTFTEPNQTGYAYEMTDLQTRQYLSHFDEEWMAAYMELVSSTCYKNADLEAQAKMIDELKTAIAKDTKKWMARQLRSAGVRSVKKE